MLQKCGFKSRGLYVMDASTRSARGNAYFTGFGKAKRIVLFDTLLAKHTPEEIESILAHELGHFKFGHIRQMLAMAAGLAFVGFAALHWALGPQGLSVFFSLPADPGLGLIIAVLAKDPLMHILSPLMAWRSRRAEFEADDFAKRMVGKEPMIAALTRLTRDNLATLTRGFQCSTNLPDAPLSCKGSGRASWTTKNARTTSRRAATDRPLCRDRLPDKAWERAGKPRDSAAGRNNPGSRGRAGTEGRRRPIGVAGGEVGDFVRGGTMLARHAGGHPPVERQQHPDRHQHPGFTRHQAGRVQQAAVGMGDLDVRGYT